MKKMIGGYPFISHEGNELTANEMLEKTGSFFLQMQKRRSVRTFTNEPVPEAVIENIIKTAGTAPSGANKQPWTFCLVANADIKKQIRLAAEAEEKLSYESRMPDNWKEDLAPLGTNWEKSFLETAPYLIVVFRKSFDYDTRGRKSQHYYVTESCGIACGFLITAIHQAGLGALTHTPSPMNFLGKILNRPENEKPYLLIPVGHMAKPCFVPDIKRKEPDQIRVWYR